MFLWMKTSTTQKQVSLGFNFLDISEKVQGNGTANLLSEDSYGLICANRMDLFDTSAHLSCKIPIRATTRPLLKSAICALAAKHLSRTQSDNCEKQSTRSARASLSSPTSSTPDLQYHAVRYYHRAIRCLKDAIALDGYDDTRDMDGGRHTDTFAAVAILCMYELMNAPGNAWKAHLTALPLYSASDSNLTGCSPVPIPQSPIKGPIFWSLARQDFLCACRYFWWRLFFMQRTIKLIE